jgi:hypothetical protein
VASGCKWHFVAVAIGDRTEWVTGLCCAVVWAVDCASASDYFNNASRVEFTKQQDPVATSTDSMGIGPIAIGLESQARLLLRA